MSRKELKAAHLQKLVDEFNQKYPVGMTVILTKDFGEEIKTKVRHPAYVLQGHSAVAFFEGVSGCYHIEGRVREAQ
jgi:hypothetical protein